MAEADNSELGVDQDRAFEEEERQDRMYVMLGTILLIVLVIIVILFFWRSCGQSSESGDARGGGAQIVSVPALDPVENAVSVWVRPNADLASILARNDVDAGDIADLGDGTYVMTVADAESAVEKLKEDPGLYDAGFIYTEDE